MKVLRIVGDFPISKSVGLFRQLPRLSLDQLEHAALPQQNITL